MKKRVKKFNKNNNPPSSRDNNRNKFFPFVLIILLLAIIILVIFLKPDAPSISGKAVFTPSVPQSCSGSDIAQLWDSIFKESSPGITVEMPGEQTSPCGIYEAYKVKGDFLYYLFGRDVLFSDGDSKTILAFYVNMTPECRDIITSKEGLGEIYQFEGNDIFYLPEECVNLRETAYSASQAQNEFNSIFKIEQGDWILNSTETTTYYSFMKNETIENEGENTTKMIAGATSLEHSISTAIYAEDIFLTEGCVPSWVPENTSCINETLTTFYTDENDCNIEEEKPQNETLSCNTSLEDVVINYINQTNVTASTLREFRINKDGSLRIIIYAELSETIDMSGMELKTQKNGSSFGYTIINGIEYAKTVIVDKLDPDSNQVCIKDAHVSDISELSKPCNSDNESLVDCPGTEGQYSCEINESKFIVSGLTSSAIKEVTGKETACAPVWNCTSWFPSICPASEKQTRLCFDKNNCKTNAGKPEQSQECTQKSISLDRATIIKIIIFIIVLAIIIAAIITAVIVYQKRKHAEFQKPEVKIKEKSVGIRQPPKEEITKPKEEAKAEKKEEKKEAKAEEKKTEAKAVKEDKGVNIKE